jgi:pyruvate/2-oxoglutarate dehydrogenase complex dihydrolipoamide acyltransferase (E2) component
MQASLFVNLCNPHQRLGKIAEQVVPVNGQVSIQPMLTLTVSYDHRVIDSARGAQLLETVANYLGEPLKMENYFKTLVV